MTMSRHPRWRFWLAQAAGLLVTLTAASPSHAVPSYARQTGQDCVACHVGGFGPQLTPYGVKFKLGGYADTDLAKFGVPTEREYLAAYARRTGRAGIEHWDFYLAFSLFRLAAIVQGVYKRGLDGNASSETAKNYGDRARVLAELGWSMVEKRA